MTAFGSDNLRLAAFCERDLETLVCARGAKLSLKALSKRLESPRRGSRGLIYDLPATAEACEDPRTLRPVRRQLGPAMTSGT